MQRSDGVEPTTQTSLLCGVPVQPNKNHFSLTCGFPGLKSFPYHSWTGIAIFNNIKMSRNDTSEKHIHIHVYTNYTHDTLTTFGIKQLVYLNLILFKFRNTFKLKQAQKINISCVRQVNIITSSNSNAFYFKNWSL